MAESKENMEKKIIVWSSMKKEFLDETILSVDEFCKEFARLGTTSEDVKHQHYLNFPDNTRNLRQFLGIYFRSHIRDVNHRNLCYDRHYRNLMLQHAISIGNLDVVKEIINFPRLLPEDYINLRNEQGTTPYICSVKYGGTEITKFLLEKGADPKDKELIKERRSSRNAPRR